eukprot:m.758658 g.758658  ORF g.758658 m.758658 type:complete len:87 (+) comp23193_c0_seq21:4257-4517(+)
MTGCAWALFGVLDVCTRRIFYASLVCNVPYAVNLRVIRASGPTPQKSGHRTGTHSKASASAADKSGYGQVWCARAEGMYAKKESNE